MMPAIRSGAARYMAPGLDFEDAVQEGLIGLFDAVRGWDSTRQSAFVSYAVACIHHAQLDAARAATRKKHAPLNDSVPLPEDSATPGPEELAIARRGGGRCDPPDADPAFPPWNGRRCSVPSTAARLPETAQLLGRDPKAVENALARARRKLRGAP